MECAAFPEFVCPYAAALAARSPRFALQAYDPPDAQGGDNAPDEAFGADPFGELAEAAKCPGLKQRFPDRVLIMAADTCFMNCRHCTRRGLFGKTTVVRTGEQLQRCVDYVREHPDVRDVLISGGDPLTLADAWLEELVAAFAALSQVEIVRVCTRAPCVNPKRITPALVRLLSASGKVWVNTQFNCADEVTDEARAAAARMVNAGIPVSCQTVLLKGVNDSVEELLSLFRKLSAARIRPYYVFTCDPIAGIGRFRVGRDRALELERACAERIGGLSLPRFVSDIPGAKRKIPVAETV